MEVAVGGGGTGGSFLIDGAPKPKIVAMRFFFPSDFLFYALAILFFHRTPLHFFSIRTLNDFVG